jgi:hypothetical protein
MPSTPTPIECGCRVAEDSGTQVAALLPHPYMPLASNGGGVWLVLDNRLLGVTPSLALILVVKFLGREGTSSRLW